MHIAFPMAGKLNVAEAHGLAEVFLASVRSAMPGARVTQVSDQHFPALPGVDAVFRHPWVGDWIDFRFSAFNAFAMTHGEHLGLEYDIVVRKDVSDVMKGDFDVAMCVTPDRADAVLNGGVTFCKHIGFWANALRVYQSRPDLRDGWEGGQTAQSMAAKAMRCKFLDFDTYNFTPNGPGMVPESAAIVHYRGRRKKFMAKDNLETVYG